MIGKTVSHYKILEQLGEGGMGVVYKALDTKLKRTVALKFLSSQSLGTQDEKTRFVHEAQAAASLDHPNICAVYEIDEVEGQTFIAMAYVDGLSLREKTQLGPLKLEEALNVAIDIAQGLQEAHEKDIVHRDIKSANVMVTKKGQAKITDFGLAKLAGSTRVTKTGTSVGTAAYMSPEQALGESVDQRSDIWSLGVVLYEMLTGRLPFSGDHEQAVTYQIVHEDAEPVTALRTGIPMELERIVGKCLGKKAPDRYQHVDELVVDLRNIKKAPTPKPKDNLIRYAVVALAVVIVGVTIWKLLQQNAAVSPTEAMALAVVDFRDLGTPDDVTSSAGIASLVQVGLVESGPCRVVSPHYLYDLRRRLFGAGRGPIEEDQALEVARESGATMLLSGQMVTVSAHPYITWQLVDTRNGKSLGARRLEGENLAVLADRIIADVLPLLAKECGVEEPIVPRAVSALTTSSQEAHEHYIAGVLADEQWNESDAIREFEQAVKIDSTFALAYYELSRIYFYALGGSPQENETQDYAEKAWKYRARLGVKDRLRLEAWREQINLKLTEAIAINREMLTRWPDDREVLGDLSGLLFYHWYFDEAISLTREALSLYPGEWVFVNVYANSSGVLGRLREALDASRSYAEQHPEEYRAWLEVEARYYEMGLADSAETALRRALDIDPASFFDSQRYISYCHYVRGDLQRAIENHERLLARNDVLPGQRMRLLATSATPDLPVLYAENGRFEKALEQFEEARQLVSDLAGEITIGNRRNVVLLRSGRAEEVLRWARELEDRADVGFVAYRAALWEARALVALDSLDAARSAQARARALAPRAGVFRALHARAEIELADEDPETALATLAEMERVGLRRGGGLWYIEYCELLARAHRMAGRLDEAAKVHEELLQEIRGHSLSHYDLAQIYEDMARTVDAEREYAAFLAAWAEADEGLPQVEDAKMRLNTLRQTSQ